MALVPPDVAAQIAFILGITNVIGLLLVLSTCRCLPGSQIFNFLARSERYMRKFYPLHCYFWYLFIGSVILHAFFAITGFGVPFRT